LQFWLFQLASSGGWGDLIFIFRHFSLPLRCFGWLFLQFWLFQLASSGGLGDLIFIFRHFSLPLRCFG
jgi:hypothetical protein